MYSVVGLGGLGLCVGGYDTVDGSSCEGGSIGGGGSAGSGSSGGGNNWGSFFQSLIKQGVNIVDKIYTPPTYTVGADGSVAYRGGQAGGAAVGSANPGGGAFASIPSSWVWIGGGGLVLVLILASKGGGRR